MAVAIVGATGGTGRAAVNLALAAGQEVWVVARRPDALASYGDRIRVERADARDAPGMARAFAAFGAPPSAVICVVGAASLWEARRSTDLCTTAARNLQAAVPPNTAIVAVSSGGVEPQPHDGFFYKWILKPLFLEPLYVDLRGMEAVWRGGSHPWTIVRAPYLSGDQLTHDVEWSTDGPLPDDGSLTRPDLAEFLVRAATDPGPWRDRTVWIQNPPAAAKRRAGRRTAPETSA